MRLGYFVMADLFEPAGDYWVEVGAHALTSSDALWNPSPAGSFQ